MSINAVPSKLCPFMAELIDVLTEPITGHEGRRTDAVALRLDRLEYEARWHGAREATLEAIQGARALLGIAELPPLPRSRS